MIQMYFGKACKEYREEMNISQEKFALSIGIACSFSTQATL